MTKLTNEEIIDQIHGKKRTQDEYKEQIRFMHSLTNESQVEIKRLVGLRDAALAKEKYDLAKRHSKNLLRVQKRLDKLFDVTFEIHQLQVYNGRSILALRNIITDRRELKEAGQRLKEQTLTGARNLCTRFKGLFGGKTEAEPEVVPKLELHIEYDADCGYKKEDGEEGDFYTILSNDIPHNHNWSIAILSNVLPFQPIYSGEHTMYEGPLKFPYLPLPGKESPTRIIKIVVHALDYGNVGNAIYLVRRRDKWQVLKDGEYHWSRLLDSQSKPN